MCYRCVMQATDLMWDRAREIVNLRQAGPGAPLDWLDLLNVGFWREFKVRRSAMRAKLEELSKVAIERLALASGGATVTPREAASYINCQWLASFAAHAFGNPDWLRPTALAFDLLLDPNDPFLDLIGMPGIEIEPGETHSEVIHFGGKPHDAKPTEPPHGHRPRF